MIIATHLLVRSSYSMLKGTMSVKKIVSKAKELGYSAVALSDFHVLHGALEFQLEAEKQSLKPIFGMEITFDFMGVNFQSLLIAKNNKGYQHLMKLSFELSKGGSIDLAQAYSDSIFLIVFSENGPFEHYLLGDDWESIELMMNGIKDIFFFFKRYRICTTFG